ncbi:MAG: DUF2862 domain-containing protein [Aphanocapsa feldmannii 277cV]|uniref:DUF2862 domain-containing protein n=2 Tax=Aphanocapsa feldmannii TaxID=192050 RepID=A0A524RNH5_9CHRO|nr:MAG: DUF2862 domain-containing protein [Aphanocapsa feldmannii 288cV]TGG92612.1 MAG: DUF2862 domain-containing protein [Aphanocapsa feldmannii 277cV]TGH27292.1 MAG: DUF2862 domain-containing protein [Aphanocapsa feldmannii 277cI]
MSQAGIEIGSKVRIVRVRDRIPADMVDMLRREGSGVVTGYQMTDGSGVGVVVTFSNGRSSWFFDDEITLT